MITKVVKALKKVNLSTGIDTILMDVGQVETVRFKDEPNFNAFVQSGLIVETVLAEGGQTLPVIPRAGIRPQARVCSTCGSYLQQIPFEEAGLGPKADGELYRCSVCGQEEFVRLGKLGGVAVQSQIPVIPAQPPQPVSGAGQKVLEEPVLPTTEDIGEADVEEPVEEPVKEGEGESKEVVDELVDEPVDEPEIKEANIAKRCPNCGNDMILDGEQSSERRTVVQAFTCPICKKNVEVEK